MSPDCVREFQPADQDHVVSLWARVFPDDPLWNQPLDVIRRKLEIQPHLFLVCVIEGKLVGTVIAGFDGVRGWIHKMAVMPECQQQGIGAKLMAAAEDRLALMGCPKINLQVRSSNIEVVAFYRGLGYAVEDRVSMGKLIS